MLQVETRPSGKAPHQADIKFLTKTTTNKITGIPTGITSAVVNMQMKTTFLKEIP